MENGEAQANDLGFFTEPPDGIEPSRIIGLLVLYGVIRLAIRHGP
ncbi:hypothetical protein ABZ541_15345 [Micromonospora sediminicola]